jgi:ABC-2 type transport system ATP-binding protein
MISVSHLVKRYGSRAAVNDVSFEVGRGDVVGFLGPNGAGKSTTLRILAGFLGFTEGTVSVAGHDVVSDSFEARKAIGYMPEMAPLYPEMRVSEYLTFRAELKGVARRDRVSWVGRAMDQARVLDVANRLISTLSKGYRQRVGLADALVARPPILILDEPTAGMDPNQIRDVRAVVKDLGATHTVLLSTHILSEVEATCSRVIVIAKGKLVAEGETRDLAKMRRTSAALVTVRGRAEDAKKALKAVKGMGQVRALPETKEQSSAKEDEKTCSFRFMARAKEDVQGAVLVELAVLALVQAGLAIREVRPAEGSLEDLFAELTGGEGSESDEADDGAEGDATPPAKPGRDG